MRSVAIVTDSNSGLSSEDARRAGITVLPMPVLMDEEVSYEGVNLDRQEFFTRLTQGFNVQTSQPSPGSLLASWDDVLQEADSLVYLPMSGGLSSAVYTAEALAEDYEGRVVVVDNRRISCTQRMAALEAAGLAELGYSAREIGDILTEHAKDASIYISVDTLCYLKRGGRITAAGAAIVTALNLKPILRIDGGKLDAYAKARGNKQAQQALLSAVQTDQEKRFCGRPVTFRCAGTCSDTDSKVWTEIAQSRFPDHTIGYDPLALSISCHIGPGSYAIVCMAHLPQLGEEFYKVWET